MYSMPLYFNDRPITDEDRAAITRDWRATDPLPLYHKFREMPMAIIEENEMPQWKDPKQIWDAVNAMGTNFVRYPAIGWAAHFYGESKSLPKYPAMKPEEDFFGDVSKYFHERGGYVCSYNHFGGVMYGTTLELHPDWVARDKDGNPIPWNDMHYYGCLCSDGFVDAMLTAFDEYIDRYHTDMVYLDAPAWYHDWCHCEGCKKLWREYFGEEIPDECPECSPTREKLYQLRDRRYYAIIRAVHAVTQKHGVPFIINARGHSNARKGNKELNLTVVEGANAGEGYRPSASFWSMATLWRLGEAEKNIQYAYCPTGPYDNFRSYGTDETLAVGMGQVMFGMTPFLESGTSYFFDTTGSEKLCEVTKNIADHAPMYYRTAPIRDLGLVSDEYILSRVSEKRRTQLIDEYQGCVEALTHSGRHFDCLFDDQLGADRLRGYRAIYLPNTAYVSPAKERALRQYVEEGGSVICGPDFSRFDEHMKPLSNYTMADFLGADFVRENDRKGMGIDLHRREYRESASIFSYAPIPEAYVRLTSDLPGMPASSPVIPFADTVVRVERPINMFYTISTPHDDTEILAELFLPAGGLRGEPLDFPDGTPPAITRHAYGRGFVYQLHFRPGYVYQHRGLPDNKQLICAVCDAPGNGPVIKIDAPGAVLCFYVENAEGVHYLHLSSYTGVVSERSMMLDRIAPLYNVPFRIREDAPIRRISTVYGGEEIDFVREDGYVSFTLPKLEIYESLKIEVE